MLERVTWLTPYAAEEIAQEASRAGPAPGRRGVPATTSDDGLAAVEPVGWLREKRVSVVIVREQNGR
jgi:hypothetical protein